MFATENLITNLHFSVTFCSAVFRSPFLRISEHKQLIRLIYMNVTLLRTTVFPESDTVNPIYSEAFYYEYLLIMATIFTYN